MELQDWTVTALGPNDPDDGDAGRLMRGMAIAAMVRIEKHRLGYRVPSQSHGGTYIVNTDDSPVCSCPDFDLRQQPCKHIYAVHITIQREELPDGTTVETASVTTTYRQEWPAYDAAQEHEQEHFVQLLRGLCDTIPQPPQSKGRPRLPLSDSVFGAALKVYGTKSMRRTMTDIRDAKGAGLMDKAQSRASVLRCIEDPSLTPLLKNLIEMSALPLRAIEQDFAADSTGFGTNTYTRWFDKKWGKMINEAKWVKAHVMCGVKTNIITAVEVTSTDSADSPFFVPFVQTTAQHFKVKEVSGDKAYLSKKNLRAVEAVGGTAYIPFKSNSNPTQGHHKYDALWERAYHFFHLHRTEFLSRYHKRSNVETTFHMVKAKFGASVRSKKPEAQVNEVLLKLLCHNLVVLIQVAYDLGVDPLSMGELETFEPRRLPSTKMAWE